MAFNPFSFFRRQNRREDALQSRLPIGIRPTFNLGGIGQRTIGPATEPTISQRITNAIPQYIREGLFGVPKDEREAFQQEQNVSAFNIPGALREAYRNRGALGLYQDLFKSDRDKIDDRYDSLVSEGIKSSRALQIAMQDVRTTQEKLLDKEGIALTQGEKDIIGKQNTLEKIYASLDALDFITLGPIIPEGELLKNLVKKIAKLDNATDINKILIKEIPKAPKGVVDDVAQVLARVDNPDIIESVFKRMDFEFNKFKGVVQGDVSKLPAGQRALDDIFSQAKRVDDIPATGRVQPVAGRVDAPVVGETKIVSPQQEGLTVSESQLRPTEISLDSSLPKTLSENTTLHKSLTQDGRVLVDESDKVVFPRDIKSSVTPLASPTLIEEVTKRVGSVINRQVKRGQAALKNISKRHGETENIVATLRKQGVTPAEIDRIVLETGDRLSDTLQVKREKNGVVSAVVRKDTIEEMAENFKGTKLNTKWIPTKTAVQKAKELGRKGKAAALHYYELPQLFFDRTGLRPYFYDPVRQAERNAQNMKTAIFKQFEDAGLMKTGGWFTADRFAINEKESENIARYFLERQGKGGDRTLEDLSVKEAKFVKVFDEVIKGTEERFFKVAELNGKAPAKVDNYAPIMTSGDFQLAEELGDAEFIFRKHPAFFSLKKRAEDVPFEMYELDYRKVAASWIDQVANFNHLGEVTPQVKYLAESKHFKEVVGEEVFQITNRWLKDALNPNVLTPAEKGLRFARQKTSLASLGLNLASIVKQTLTMVPITIIEKAPPKLHSKFAKNFGINVEDLPSIKERRGNAAIMDMQEGFNRAVVGGLTEADKKIAQLDLNALLDKNYKKFLKENTHREPSVEQQALILKKSQDTLDMWFGGMTKSQLPGAFRKELGKVVNMFIMPLTSQLNGFVYAVAKEAGIKKAVKLSEVITSALVIAYLEQVITNLDVEWSDPEEMVKDTLASLAGNVPLLGQAVFAWRTDQPISASPIVNSLSRVASQTSKYFGDQVDLVDAAFAWGELFGLPKQVRRTTQGVEIISAGGVRDKNGKLLAPVKGTPESIRAFLRGKYGTIATQDWVRNIAVKRENRRWFVPEVEFLQNGDYARKAELYNAFDEETQTDLYAELSPGQQKKLDKALAEAPTPIEAGVQRTLEQIFDGERPPLESIFKQ